MICRLVSSLVDKYADIYSVCLSMSIEALVGRSPGWPGTNKSQRPQLRIIVFGLGTHRKKDEALFPPKPRSVRLIWLVKQLNETFCCCGDKMLSQYGRRAAVSGSTVHADKLRTLFYSVFAITGGNLLLPKLQQYRRRSRGVGYFVYVF